jgi:hypothetical protein
MTRKGPDVSPALLRLTSPSPTWVVIMFGSCGGREISAVLTGVQLADGILLMYRVAIHDTLRK